MSTAWQALARTSDKLPAAPLFAPLRATVAAPHVPSAGATGTPVVLCKKGMVTDEELVRRLSEGHEGALAELLRRYERPLARLIQRHTGNRDVDDLYPETWLRVVRAAPHFDPRRRFSPWLMRIALNLCRDWHRRTRADRKQVLPPASDAGATARVEAALDATRLLATLPEKHREVILLRFFHDRTEADIADLLACPVGTVKSRLHHALARLARLGRRRPI